MYTKEEVKKNLIELLNKYGQKRLTENQGIPASTVSTWKALNKTSIPNILEAYKISKEYRVPIESLVTGSQSYEGKVLFQVAEKDELYKEDQIINEIIELLKYESESVKIEAKGAVKAIINSNKEKKGGTGSETQAG